MGDSLVPDNTIMVDSQEICPVNGTPVICQGLVKASHLNGKVADVRFWDEQTGRCKIHFEEEGLKPCMVKPGNVRILFKLPNNE